MKHYLLELECSAKEVKLFFDSLSLVFNQFHLHFSDRCCFTRAVQVVDLAPALCYKLMLQQTWSYQTSARRLLYCSLQKVNKFITVGRAFLVHWLEIWSCVAGREKLGDYTKWPNVCCFRVVDVCVVSNLIVCIADCTCNVIIWMHRRAELRRQEFCMHRQLRFW